MIALAASLAAFWICAAVGAAGAWLMRRRTMLSVRNLYLAAAVGALPCGVAVLARWWGALLVIAPTRRRAHDRRAARTAVAAG
jgi:hypothetical protein